MKITIITIYILLLAIDKLKTREVVDYTTQSLINCYIRHLKVLNKIQSDFPELQTRNTITDCALSIKNVKIEIFKAVKTRLKKSKKTSPYVDCIVDYLKLEYWAEIEMRRAIIDASSLSSEEKTRTADEMRNLSDHESEMALKYCIHENELGILYDNFYGNEEDMSDDRITNFCTRKYVIDNKLSNYNITLDSDVDVLATNCEEIIRTLIDDIEKSMRENLKDEKPDVSDEQVTCTLNKYREGKYTQKLIETAVIAKIKLSSDEKAKHRRDFIKFVSSIIHEVSKCFAMPV